MHRPRRSRIKFNVHLLKEPAVTKEFNTELSYRSLQDLNGTSLEKVNLDIEQTLTDTKEPYGLDVNEHLKGRCR